MYPLYNGFILIFIERAHSQIHSIEVLRIHNEVVKVNVAQNPQSHAAKLDNYIENLCTMKEDG